MSQPEIDQALLRRLSTIATRLDGGDNNLDAGLVDEFNRLAGTEMTFLEFQGIHGAEEHIDYVRRILIDKATPALPTLDRDALVTMFGRIRGEPTDDAFQEYVFSTIEKTFGDSQVSDLIYWPGKYFGDDNHDRILTPEMMADAVLKRFHRRQLR